MKGIVTVIALVFVGLFSHAIYQLKYEVTHLEDELAELNRLLIEERKAVRVLNAEWSYLNRPERLQSLAAERLTLAPAAVRPLDDLSRVPFRTETVPGGGEDRSGPPLPRAKPKRRSLARVDREVRALLVRTEGNQ